MEQNLSFVKRTQKFWEWFAENEAQLAAFLPNPAPTDVDSNAIVELCNQGLSLIADNLNFNIGGNNEFTFATEGNAALFFLLPYVVANMPEQFRGKWHFFPCMQGTRGDNFVFRMIEHVDSVDTDNVYVTASISEDKQAADLRVYVKEWEALDDNQFLGAFFILMDIVVGEALSYTCIRNVERVRGRTDGMISLTNLGKWLLDNLCEDGKVPDPANRHSSYQQTPDENAMPPRNDIFVGVTNYMHTISGYHMRDSYVYDTFVRFGAKPVFVYYYYGEGDNQKEVLNRRYELMDKLEAVVLGERGSGKEIGLMLGGAMGKWCAYIDLLLFDEQEFMQRAKALLADEPTMFFGKDFVHEGRDFLLLDQNDANFNQRLEQLHRDDIHFEIVKIMEGMTDMDYTQKGLYARALNNVSREGDALKVLESVMEQGKEDKLWYFRYGYALMGLNRHKDAIAAFRRAQELGDTNADTNELIAMCEAALEGHDGK